MERFEDYSFASPWERFVSQIASVLRDWGCTDASFLPTSSAKASPLRCELEFEGYVYQVALHVCGARSLPAWPDDRSLRSLAPSSVDMLSSRRDFASHPHDIARWFGLRQYVTASVARPVNAPIGGLFGDGTVTMGRNHGEWLLTSVRLAMRECGASFPVFVALMAPEACHYVGVCDPGAQHGDVATRFETASATVHAAPSRRSFCSLESLCALFRAKMNLPSTTALTISSRYEWSVSCGAREIRPLVRRAHADAHAALGGGVVNAHLSAWAAFEELARGGEEEGFGSDLCSALWRPRRSVLREVSVSVHFTAAADGDGAWSEAAMVRSVVAACEDSVDDDAAATAVAAAVAAAAAVEESGGTEQMWEMECCWSVATESVGQPLTACFARLHAMLQRVLRDIAAKRVAEQQQQARLQRVRDGSGVPAERTAALVGSAIGNGLGMLLRSRRDALERSSAADFEIALLAFGLGRPGAAGERAAADAGGAARADLGWLGRSVPPGSLLSQLALHMAGLDSVEAVVVLWKMVVEQLRWHWDNAILVRVVTTSELPWHCGGFDHACPVFIKCSLSNGKQHVPSFPVCVFFFRPAAAARRRRPPFDPLLSLAPEVADVERLHSTPCALRERARRRCRSAGAYSCSCQQ